MKTGRYILTFLILLLIAVSGNLLLDNWHYKKVDHRRLQKEINKKFKRTDRWVEKLQAGNWQLNTSLPNDEGIVVLAYRNDSLIYWSDNSLSFSLFSEGKFSGSRFQFISNGWYVIKPYLNDSLRAYGLILVKTEYPYENDYLESRFQPDLKLPASTELYAESKPGSFSVLDWEGIYLFSIKFRGEEIRYAGLEKYFIPVMFLLAMISLLLLIHRLFGSIRKPGVRNLAVLLLIPLFVLMRWLQYRYHIPVNLYDLELFGPVPFAKSSWLPSLGDVLINTILILFVIIEFFSVFTFMVSKPQEKAGGSPAAVAIMIITITFFFIYTHFLLSTLILHSTINFEFYRVASLSVYTVIGLMITTMHFVGLLLLTNKLLSICPSTCSLIKLLLVFFLISSGIFVALYLVGYPFDYGSYLAFAVLFAVIAFTKYRKMQAGNYTTMAFMVMFFSVYSVYFFSNYTRQKLMNNMRVMASNLATQHDPVAEYLLYDVSTKLSNDETFQRYLFSRVPDDQIFNYLRNRYFNGFWGKYKIRFQVCDPYINILVDEDSVSQWVNCSDYYAGMLSGGSMQLPGTNFYYLDIQNGQINYLGWLKYKQPGHRNELSFYLELSSRLVAEELGFPDLLLDTKFQKNKLLETYSFARYNKNQLVTQSGTFQYSLDLNTYKNRPDQFEGYNHLIYYVNKDNAVMVSKPTATFFDKLVSFSYIFLFLYLLAVIYVGIKNYSTFGKDFTFNFKNKIQLSIMAILFLSLILVGGGTIYFSIQQYQRKQHDILSEKIQSVYVELDHLLAYLPNRINPDWRNGDYASLNQLLIKFSDVFYSDINLYDPDGNLLATSRSDLFDRGIVGRKMDPRAYSKMVTEKQAEFIHPESVGNMTFLSAYVPFVNAQNKLLAYLNLPYFTRQNVLRSDVTTLVVAIVNVYVLLILITIAMTAFISDQITRPLRLIQKKFSEIKIGRKNEQIYYRGHDEIAGLVDEYNRMVQELVKSLEMLSRSERESAWREMAKQIAHEIKNPLTPMKLSVQHLQRTWQDNRDNFEEYLDKVTRTLIEQIDNLSFIASEFSNFAKMPKASNEEINIVDKVRSTLNLFANTENVDFVFEHESDQIIVFADKEQLSRVFINLIKNAIQSIPDNRQGKVGISLILNGNMVRVSITDNGKGIPEELQSKMFTPSFTTKSSGMGLGLSIVKSIIESFGGTITFKTRVNHGTTFVFEIPVYAPAEQESSN